MIDQYELDNLKDYFSLHYYDVDLKLPNMSIWHNLRSFGSLKYS